MLYRLYCMLERLYCFFLLILISNLNKITKIHFFIKMKCKLNSKVLFFEVRKSAYRILRHHACLPGYDGLNLCRDSWGHVGPLQEIGQYLQGTRQCAVPHDVCDGLPVQQQ